MKTQILLYVLMALCSSSLIGQHPKVFLTKDEIVSNKIDQVVCFSDSASDGYQLPIDTLRVVNFDNLGRTTLDRSYTKEAVLIQHLKKIKHFGDSTVIVLVDSSIDAPAYLEGVHISKYVEHYENSQLVRINNYSTNNIERLQFVEYFYYNSAGQKSKEVIAFMPRQSSSTDILVQPTNTTEKEFYYDEEGRLLMTHSVSEGYRGETVIIEEKYENLKDRTIKSRRSSKSGNQWKKVEEIVKNESGQIIEIIKYNRNGELWFITHFQYNEEGLLELEEAYRNENEFAYRYRTIYVLRK